jgi:hypothetical protein
MIMAVAEGSMETVKSTAERGFKNPTGASALAWKVEYDPQGTSANIKNSKEYMYYLNVGIKRQQMTWLLNSEQRQYVAKWKGVAVSTYWARAPIPLKVGNSTIFRRPSEKSMAEGKWMHPGIHEMAFVTRGLVEFKYLHLPQISKDVTMEVIIREIG